MQDRVGSLEGERDRSRDKIKRLEMELANTRKTISFNMGRNHKLDEMPSSIDLQPMYAKKQMSEDYRVDDSFQIKDESLLQRTTQDIHSERTGAGFETRNFEMIESDLKNEFTKYADSLNNVQSKSLTKEMPAPNTRTKKGKVQKRAPMKEPLASVQKKPTTLEGASIASNDTIKARLIERIVNDRPIENPTSSNPARDPKMNKDNRTKTHNRIKGQIEIPNVIGRVGNDANKRQMPFIVGKVLLINI